MRLRLVGAAVAAVVMLLALASGAQAVGVKLPDGQFLGVTPRNGVSPASIPGSLDKHPAAARGGSEVPSLAPFADPAGNVAYNGGPVIHTERPYLIFWDPSGPAIPSTTQTVLEQYLTDVAADNGETGDTYGVGRQYYDSSGFADAAQSFSANQAIVDTQAYPTQDTAACPNASGFATCVTDTQVTDELSRLIAARNLPDDGPFTQPEQELPGNAPVYYVILPANVNTCYDSGGSPLCASSNGGFCAYHSAYLDSLDSSNIVLYAQIPMAFITVGAKGCQVDGTSAVQEPNANVADVIADNLSHENNETVTDPLGDGWVNSSTDGQELADNCEAYGPTADPTNPLGPTDPNAYAPVLGGSASGTLFDQLINGDHYYTQSLWSNGQADCELQPTPATLTPSFGFAGVTLAGQAARIDATGTTASAGVASATWSWGDGTSSFYPGSVTPVTHTYAAAGAYSATLTVVDDNGNVANLTKQVFIRKILDPVIGTLPSSAYAGAAVTFNAASSSDPNAGGSLTGYSWSFGDGASGTGVTTSHTYSAPGTYTATLTVTDSYGVTTSQTATVDVVPAPPDKISKVRFAQQRGSVYVFVTVPQGGTLTYAGHSTKLRAAGTAKLKVRLTGKQQRQRARGHRVVITVKVVYVPAYGARVTKTAHYTLLPRRR